MSVRSGPIDPEWDAFVAGVPGGHHVQSSLWGQVKAEVGWHGERVILRRGSEIVAGGQLLVRRLVRGAELAFMPRGPLARGGDVELSCAALDALQHVAQRRRFLYVKVQVPAGYEALVPALAARGFVASSLEAAPTATVRVDLTPDLETVERRMRRNARRKIRDARRVGVTTRTGGEPELSALYAIMRETGRRQNFAPYAEHYYRAIWEKFAARGHGVLLVAEHDDEVVAASLLVALGDTAACKMAVARIGPDRPPTSELIHLASMAWAKQQGHGYYDLDGIAPEAASRWAAGGQAGSGVAQFKLGLGGEVVTGPGSWDRSFQPLIAPLARRVAPQLHTWLPVARRLLGRGR